MGKPPIRPAVSPATSPARLALAKAGYRESKSFDGPNLGYFCSTCDAFSRTDLGAPPGTGKVGRCLRVKAPAPADGRVVPVKSYGLCNLWCEGDQLDWTLANGTG